MFGQLESMFRCDGLLSLLDLRIVKLFHVPALHAEQVVVMSALVQFVYGLVVVEVMADQESGLLELG